MLDSSTAKGRSCARSISTFADGADERENDGHEADHHHFGNPDLRACSVVGDHPDPCNGEQSCECSPDDQVHLSPRDQVDDWMMVILRSEDNLGFRASPDHPARRIENARSGSRSTG